jgi:HAMP domain-containing protein
MLRRKFLTRVGLLICAFVIGAAGAVWALQDILARVDHAYADASFLMDGVQGVDAAVNRIEAARNAGGAAPAADIRAAMAADLAGQLERLAQHPVTSQPGKAADLLAELRGTLPEFLASFTSDSGAPASAEASLRTQQGVERLARELRARVAEEQKQAGRRFRGLVLILTLAALVMVNVAIYVLLRTAQMVLKPVGALVDGSRELAAERFDHRVDVGRDDEFGELAHAYNRLAAQLQANEDRKAETLRQLAVTINHGLNNTMAIIELQLGLLARQSNQDPKLLERLREIRAGLTRMAQLVASLKNIRRVVLTDYAPGQKMVDLERSVADELADAPTPTIPAPTTPTPAESA